MTDCWGKAHVVITNLLITLCLQIMTILLVPKNTRANNIPWRAKIDLGTREIKVKELVVKKPGTGRKGKWGVALQGI